MFAQSAFGFDGSEAFVPELEREAGPRSQAMREVPDGGRLSALASGECLWMANEQEADLALAGQKPETLEVVADVGPVHGRKPLGGQTEGVRQGEPDPFGADIERQYPSRLSKRR